MKLSSYQAIKLKANNGFTIIELLITVAIVVIVTATGFVSLSGYRSNKNLKLSVNEITSVIRDVQNSSVTQKNGKQWGIRFGNSTSSIYSYQIFSGASYATSAVDKTYSLSRGIRFSEPASGFNVDEVFAAMTGKLSANKIISLITGRADGYVGDIIMHTAGSVTTRQETGLVGYWHFDENTATTTYDASGMGNSGNASGTTWFSGSNCRAGSCLSFDGTNNYIQLGTSQSYANAVTVSAWVYHNSTADWDDIVAGGCGNILFGFSSNVLSFGGQCNNPFTPVSYSTNINSAWHHVAGVYNNLLATLYVDGLAVSSSTKSGSFSVFTPSIGGEGTAENFNGFIDEVRIYNRALSATEILNIYNDLK